MKRPILAAIALVAFLAELIAVALFTFGITLPAWFHAIAVGVFVIIICIVGDPNR